MISVIIPTYNRARLLHQALHSVFLQTYQNIEIIVIDDGSTDNTRDVVMMFPKVIYIFQDNQHISAARNKGISIARGKFLAFLDSDDLWAPEHLEKSLNLMDDDVGLVGGSHAYFNNHGRIIKTNIEIPKPEGYLFNKIFLEGTPFQTSTALVRKTLVDKYGGFNCKVGCFKNGCIGEDYEFFCRIAMHTKIKYVDDVFVYYRTHDDNITNKNAVFVIHTGKKYLSNLYPELLPFLGRAEAEAFARSGFISLNNHMRVTAFFYFLLSIFKSPLNNPKGRLYPYKGIIKTLLTQKSFAKLKKSFKPDVNQFHFCDENWKKIWKIVSQKNYGAGV